MVVNSGDTFNVSKLPCPALHTRQFAVLRLHVAHDLLPHPLQWASPEPVNYCPCERASGLSTTAMFATSGRRCSSMPC